MASLRTAVDDRRRLHLSLAEHSEAPDGPDPHMKVLPTSMRFAKWSAYLGLVCGVLYSFGGVVVDLLTVGLNWGTVMAFGALVGMPVAFGVPGFFLGALVALVAQGVGAVLDRA
ncbi:MAG: hypothetical protein HN899_14920 [Gemmatimonadales bacterium]|nr:hypothetical protein [Gemmatimonadales bacterium]